MLDVHKQLTAAEIPGDKSRVRRELDATDGQIDELVYELYGLKEEEIKIVQKEFWKQGFPVTRIPH